MVALVVMVVLRRRMAVWSSSEGVVEEMGTFAKFDILHGK